MTFENLIINCKSGCQKSYYIIYNEYNKMVFASSFSVVKDYEIAKDITQDVFIKLVNNITKLNVDTESKLGSWLKVTSKNLSIDYIRKHKKKLRCSDDELNNITYEDESSDDVVSIELVTNILNKLPKMQRIAIELYYLSGYSHGEISNELGINTGTSKSNLHKAKKKLTSMLKCYN